MSILSRICFIQVSFIITISTNYSTDSNALFPGSRKQEKPPGSARSAVLIAFH
ncbi:hypothetical protein HMPREF3213_01088 [Heyndrickxia coagulans]|uniref:Uncharacterized protein n=1 Tax=Heyndrickxia coagulans TaxID=1398 RepID=A0A133KWE9_HEYCO|nr:hypothetical protein HMPREF3213_01088 [Heyndrickxia coagulans]